MNPGSRENDQQKPEVFSIRLCSTQASNYIQCLNLRNEKNYEKNICEELRNKYISCINNNNNIIENDRMSFK